MQVRQLLFSLFLVMSVLSYNCSAYTISTFAGNGGSSYSGDGGQATSAEIYGPFGITVDSSGRNL